MFIYFSFNIEHNIMPTIVKIGGSENWQNRTSQHLTSHLCYSIVCKCNANYHIVENQIKIKYNKQHVIREHYRYYFGMMSDIISDFDLKLICVTAPELPDDLCAWKKYIEFPNLDVQLTKSATLRPYQLECVNKIIENSDNKLCCLPTGSGKSLIMKNIAEYLYDKRIIILSPSVNIIESQQKVFDDTIDYQWVKKGSLIDTNKRIHHMTMGMFRNIDINPDVIIFDEAHHDKAKKTKAKIDKLQCRVIGFTATPNNNDKIDYEYKISDAVKEGYLKMPELHIVTEDIINDHLNNLISRCKNKRGIIYFDDENHMLKWKDKLKIDDITICTDIKNNKLDEDKFKNKDKQCLMLACRKYTEGYDDETLELGVKMNFNESKSIRLIIQMMGRLTRISDKMDPIFILCVKNDEKAYETFIGKYYELLCMIGEDIKDIEIKGNKMLVKMSSGYEMAINMNGLNIYSGDKIEYDIQLRIHKDEVLTKWKLCKKNIKEMTKTQYHQLKDKLFYVKNPEIYFAKYWKSLDHFLGWNTSNYPNTKEEWKIRCHELGITGSIDYYKKRTNDIFLYDDYYKNFSNIDDELGNNFIII